MASAGRLTGKVAVVTGSTDGIGLAIAKRFLTEGSKVVISSRKQENVSAALEKLHCVADEHKIDKSNIEGLVCHVSKAQDRARLLSHAKAKFGPIDTLVNNVAISPTFGPMCDVDASSLSKMLDTNVNAAFLMCRESLDQLKCSGNSSILFISSIAGYQPMPAIGGYSVTKTALLGLTKALAVELAPFNIRVNCLAPGVIRTKFSQALTENDHIAKMYQKLIPMRRFAETDEMGGPAVFLCSDDASYITGETIVASGGLSSKL